jgi:RHS repeat-associated protein
VITRTEQNTLSREVKSDAGVYKYKYNSKELQDDLIGSSSLDWYDYGARFYDASLGRWHAIDPMTFLSFEITPYHFVRYNPINRVDPFGLTDYNVNGQIRTINDGNDDVEINVTNRQFRRLQKKFNRSNSEYNSYMNKLSTKNGYTTNGKYFDEFSKTGFGVEIRYHKSGSASYTNWSQRNTSSHSVELMRPINPSDANYYHPTVMDIIIHSNKRNSVSFVVGLESTMISIASYGNKAKTVIQVAKASNYTGALFGIADNYLNAQLAHKQGKLTRAYFEYTQMVIYVAGAGLLESRRYGLIGQTMIFGMGLIDLGQSFYDNY